MLIRAHHSPVLPLPAHVHARQLMGKLPHAIPWLLEGEKFPPLNTTWGSTDPAPGLLAAGSTLDVSVLVDAYSRGIFPWYSVGQPILWWSPNPRMVLQTQNFRLHRSLRKRLCKVRAGTDCEIRMDHAFAQVIAACATTSRTGQSGTWIVPDMVRAYTTLHAAGHAHSVETWIDGQLAGGLYCINLGGMVFGESMFSRQTDASKIALAALVAFCREQQISMIDCQQNTHHLASLGAMEIARELFVEHLAEAIARPAPAWNFKPVYWDQLLLDRPPHSP
jgi:leucyl/phenylalanyl-tRNA---protein transferase